MRNQLRTTENNSSQTDKHSRSLIPNLGFWNIFNMPFADMQKMEPRIEVSETKQNILVTAELPGVNEKDIDLQISANGYLTIQGEKHYKTEENIDGGYFSEISYGHVSRTVPLPQDLDYTKASAEYNNGILNVTIPKNNIEQSSSKKIAVNNRKEAQPSKQASSTKQKSNKQSSAISAKRGRHKKQS